MPAGQPPAPPVGAPENWSGSRLPHSEPRPFAAGDFLSIFGPFTRAEKARMPWLCGSRPRRLSTFTGWSCLEGRSFGGACAEKCTFGRMGIHAGRARLRPAGFAAAASDVGEMFRSRGESASGWVSRELHICHSLRVRPQKGFSKLRKLEAWRLASPLRIEGRHCLVFCAAKGFFPDALLIGMGDVRRTSVGGPPYGF